MRSADRQRDRPPPSRFAASPVRDSLFNGLSFAVRVVGTVAVLSWIARGLGPARQGRLMLALWAAVAVGQVASWGMGPAATRFVARAVGGERRDEAAAIAHLTGRWTARAAAAAALLGVAAATAFGGQDRLLWISAAAYPLVLSTYLWGVGLASGLRRFDIEFVGQIAFFLALISGIGLALMSSAPVPAVMLAFLTARGLQVAVVWLGVRQLLVKPRHLSGSERRTVRRFGLALTTMTVLSALLWDRAELPILRVWVSWEELGIYAAAFGLSAMGMRVPSALAVVAGPIAAGLQGADRPDREIGATLGRASRLITFATVGPTMLAVVAAPAIVRLLYGPEFVDSGPLLQLLLVPLFLAGAGAASVQTLVATGEHALALKIEAVGVCIKMLLAVALIPVAGSLGAAAGCAAGQLVAVGAASLAARRRFEMSEPGRWPAHALVAACVAGGAGAAGLLGPEPMELPLQVAGGVVGWLVAALATRPLVPGDLDGVHFARRLRRRFEASS